MPNPYDELPYRSAPIEHTAPERLALASLLHGGPRVALDAGYRVLELGCADGANLLPMAWFRRHASFVGIDGARTQIQRARARAAALGLENLEYVHADLTEVDARLTGQFDFIVAHGVFSWIARPARDALLELCQRRLRAGGLLYLSYNARPGWNVRGMVREFLLAQTAGITGLRARVDAARDVCRRLVDAMGGEEHAYRRLMIDELRLVASGDPSYVAHEHLTPDNHAYWRSELAALLAAYGLAYVAEADFDQPWARLDDTFVGWLRAEGIVGRAIEDTTDLLLYRQFCSPIFTPAPLVRREPSVQELGRLRVASSLVRREPEPEQEPEPHDALPVTFVHRSGVEVEVTDAAIRDALVRLGTQWPGGLAVDEVLPRAPDVHDDLRLLHRSGLVELRLVEAAPADAEALHRLETPLGYRTAPSHAREPVARADEDE